MKSGPFVVIVVIIAVACFFGGYKLSASTGTEPGYFGAVEAAGYGGGGEMIEGVTEEMSDYYKPGLSRGIRWDDPALGIEMAGKLVRINERDASYPDLVIESLAEFEGLVL